ncbi:MAG: hypothetical protein Q9160_007704 [Pyrenula sp. 1 TL-2023]
MARRKDLDLEQPLQLANIVTELGGKFYLDLTADVTHLLVAQISTPKYKYVAREREDVQVVQPSFVFAVRDAWRSGEAFEMEALEEAHRLKTFSGSTICVTGFDDCMLLLLDSFFADDQVTFRTQLQETIEVHGGAYKGDLTKTVTHLIAKAPDGKKYQFAQQWGIKTVSLKWLKDSLDRGLILEESLYHPTTPFEEQGKGAWNRRADDQSHLGKRPREQDIAVEAPRKLRRTASARLGSQTNALWGDIVGAEDPETEATNNDRLRQTKSMSDMSVLLQQSKSFATDTTMTNQERSMVEPPEQAAPMRGDGLMANCAFLIHGFNEKQNGILHNTLSVNGAELVNNLQQATYGRRRYIAVPYNCREDHISGISGHEPSVEVVNDLWLEKCLHSKKFVEPSDYPPSKNVYHFPIEGFKNLVINGTAFDGIEVLHLSKLVNILGAKYDEFFKPSISVLITKTQQPSEDKLLHAYQWKIPVVSAAWFWSCLRSGLCQPYKPYLIKMPASIKAKSERMAQEAHAENISKQVASGARPKAGQPRDESRNSRTVPVKMPSETSHAAIREKQKPGADFLEGPKPPMANEELGSELDNAALGRVKKKPPALEQEDSHENTPKSQTPNQTEAQYAPFDGPYDSIIVPNPGDDPTQPADNAVKSQPNKGATIAPEKESINSAIQDLLRRKKSSTVAAQSTANNQGKKKRLLGRALSNLSNSSREGTATRPSRASSIDSMNTDGVGSVILDENSQATRLKAVSDGAGGESGRRSVNETLTGKAIVKESISIPESLSLDPSEHPYYEEQNEIEEPMPQLTQLGWDDPDEAKKLRELMVDGKKKKGKRPSSEGGAEEAEAPRIERKIIRDDEALLGTSSKWGGGRRTRTKTRSPNRSKMVF